MTSFLLEPFPIFRLALRYFLIDSEAVLAYVEDVSLVDRAGPLPEDQCWDSSPLAYSMDCASNNTWN